MFIDIKKLKIRDSQRVDYRQVREIVDGLMAGKRFAPIIINEKNVILDGTYRLLGAKHLGCGGIKVRKVMF